MRGRARADEQEEITWGMFSVPESELGLLGEVAGKDAIELGCGTAYFGAWLAKRGARVPVSTSRRPSSRPRAGAAPRLGIPMELDRGERRARCRCRTESFDLASRSTARRSGAIPYQVDSGGARLLRPGASSSSSGTRRWMILCAPDEGKVGDRALAAPVRAAPATSGRTRTRGSSSSFPHGEWIRLLRENGFEIEALHELQAPRRRRRTPTTTSSRPSGRGSGPPRRSGRRASARERPARAVILLASISPQRRAILEQLGFRSTSSRRATRSAFDGGDPPLEHAAGKARSVDGGGGRCSASTRRSSSTARLLGKPADAAAAGAMLDGSSGRRTRSSPGSACGRPRGRSCTARRPGHVPPADAARSRALPASGEWEGRAGGYAIQGLGASPRRADRGRLPERRRPPRRPPRPPPDRPLPRPLRLRLIQPCPVPGTRHVSMDDVSARTGDHRPTPQKLLHRHSPRCLARVPP